MWPVPEYGFDLLGKKEEITFFLLGGRVLLLKFFQIFAIFKTILNHCSFN